MKLGERQEQLIAEYLRAVAHAAGTDISERDREAGLARLDARIRAELERLRRPAPEETEVVAVLQRLGSTTVQASLLDAPTPEDVRARGYGDRIWLGVCGWLAERTEMPVIGVRGVALLLGCCLGPIALMAYMVGYAVMRRAQDPQKREPIDWATIAFRVARAILLVYALRVGFHYAVLLLERGYGMGKEHGLPELGDWSELKYRADEYYTYALSCSATLAGFSGLPLLGGWGKSLNRFSQALIALYAIALCWGTAKFLVGIILDFVRQFGGSKDFSLSAFF